MDRDEGDPKMGCRVPGPIPGALQRSVADDVRMLDLDGVHIIDLSPSDASLIEALAQLSVRAAASNSPAWLPDVERAHLIRHAPHSGAV